MTRAQLLSIVLALALALTATACKSGPGDPASYRDAMKGFSPALSKLDITTREASTSGDPMELDRALTKTVASAKALVSVIEKVEVSEPSLSGLHGDLLAAARNHHSSLEQASSDAKATPIPETKGLMNGSTETFLEDIQTWNDALDGM